MLSDVWEGFAAAVSRRRSWLLALGVFVVAAGFMALVGGNAEAGQAPQSVPTDADSAKVQKLSNQFPGGDRAPLIVVVGGAAAESSLQQACEGARDRMRAVIHADMPAAPVLVSADGKAAIGVVPIDAGLSGLPLSDEVKAMRTAANQGLPAGMTAHVTGGPAFGADIANAFSNANITLLAVTASVVALLLIATYRSPVLWLVPLVVIGFADRLASAVGISVASLTGLTFDGSTSGITSVLVFGAGTNYALLLISRYRQELRRHRDHRDALR
ncbi:MAG: MMPL family transporter, partial [Mycobacteriaceae bacterium]|nr:MMPL family transporter [Mycobacteriaceae bacterium]